jgi:hypothetical protein
MKLPSGPGVSAPDAADVLARATDACRRISTISAEVAVTGTVGGHRLRGRLLAGLAAPASAYLELPAPFGAPVFIFGAHDNDATLLLVRDRRVLEHGRSDAVLEAVTGVPLRPSELRTVLTGCADGSVFTEARQIGDGWLVIRGAEELYLRRARPTDPWRLVAVIHRGTSGPEWRAEYSDFLNDLPRTIRLRSVDPRRFDLRLALTQVETNVPLEPDAFKVKVPPGTPPIALDELREAGPLAGAASRSNGR